MNEQKLIFSRFYKPENKYFFPCKTKHQSYVTLANFLIQNPAHAGIFLSHTTHLKMTALKALQDKGFSGFLVFQKLVQKNGLFLE
ncbi:hypothetical protein V8P87_17510 [Acinetobacter baumannii]